MAFSIGDVVKLKSGGPPMTVSYGPYENGGTSVECFWFNGSGYSHQDFRVEMLEAAEPGGEAPKAAMINFRQIARDAG